MKCEEFEAHLNEILDERRRPEWDEQLRRHGEACRGCRDLASAYGVLFEGFFALPIPEAPADLSARVLERMQPRPLVSTRLAVMGAVFSTAAAVLVAAMLMRGNDPVAGNGGEERVAEASAAAAPQTAVATAPTNDQLPQWEKLEDVPVVGPWLMAGSDSADGAERYAELAKGTGQGLAAIVLRMPGVAGPQGVRPPTPGTVYGGGVWPLEVNEELRPITESMTETFNLLLDALPLTFWSQTRTRAS